MMYCIISVTFYLLLLILDILCTYIFVQIYLTNIHLHSLFHFYYFFKFIIYHTQNDNVCIPYCLHQCNCTQSWKIKWSVLTSSTDEATAQANGFPPNVLKWTPFANELAISAKNACNPLTRCFFFITHLALI